MKKLLFKTGGLIALILATILLVVPVNVQAAIDGITGTTFNLTASAHYISTPDGGIIYMWGYAGEGSLPQFPAPTLIVNEGDAITINLTNNLTVPTSIVFPGHKVAATGGTPGLITTEAAPSGGTVTYTFIASHAGTYTYYSGTRPELQIEMGLVGALIVRPALGVNYAYNHPDTAFDREYLEVLSDLDPGIHQLVETGNIDSVDNTAFSPVYWFINGRAFPDTIDMPNAPWLPTQPYNSLVIMSVGEKILIRVVGAGRDMHPQHTHGNNGFVIAKDGRLLQSAPGAGPDLAREINTIDSAPGQTVDYVFGWTGQDMGWDFYGHALTDDTVAFEIHDQTTLASGIVQTDNAIMVNAWDNGVAPSTHTINALIWDSSAYLSYTDAAAADAVEMITMKERAGFPDIYDIQRGMHGTAPQSWGAGVTVAYTDHGKPFPVVLPEPQNLTFGGVYSGSPFLGSVEALPPGEGGLNEFGAFAFPWHSHLEKEIVNNNVFIGGMLTLLFVLHP